jgi:hypothetical protein
MTTFPKKIVSLFEDAGWTKDYVNDSEIFIKYTDGYKRQIEAWPIKAQLKLYSCNLFIDPEYLDNQLRMFLNIQSDSIDVFEGIANHNQEKSRE